MSRCARCLVVIAFAALLAGCTAAQQRQAQGSMNDALISAQVEAKIAAIDTAAISLVHVQVNSGVVILSGPAAFESAREFGSIAGRDEGNESVER